MVDDQHRAYLVAPDVVGLLGSMGLGHATVAGDGIAHLDATENAAFDTAIRDALQPATTLMSDHDEDGALDPGEAVLLHGHHP